VIVRQILLEPPQVESELGCVAHKVFFAEFVLTLVEEVVHLPEAPLRGCRLRSLSGTAGTGMHRVEGEVPEDEAHLLTYSVLQLLDYGVGFSAVGAFVVAILHKRHRRVLRPARMVSSSDRIQTIAFPASCHVTSPRSSSSRSFEPQVAFATRHHVYRPLSVDLRAKAARVRNRDRSCGFIVPDGWPYSIRRALSVERLPWKTRPGT
jgi:hypothetical protein